jgi:hypothetical protein
MKLFKNIRSFLKIPETTTKVELTEEQIEKIDSELGELVTLRADNDLMARKNVELANGASASSTKITELTGQIETLTAANTKLEAEKVALQTEVTRLGALDGSKFTKTDGKKEKVGGETIEYSQSQKDLLDKANA